MSRIELIGMSGQVLTPDQQALVLECCAVVCSRRHRALVEQLGLPLIEITPVAGMLTQVAGMLGRGDVAILASGDPLFYGIGRTLIDHFGAERIAVHPALSAVQLACARFRVPWDDLHIVSLHGRTSGTWLGPVLARARVMLFTDSQNSPDRIAARLLGTLTEYGDEPRIKGLHIRVAENLGLPEERIIQGSLEEIAHAAFAPLNMMLIEQHPLPSQPPFPLGLTEEVICHSRGLITKNEVRAATLHRLRLPEHGVFWDIGGGSGSLSIEAARLCPRLAIHIVEKRPEEQANIRANIRRYATYNMRLTSGEAPGVLADLPAPDRIFVGGGGADLAPILAASVPRLARGGRIVVNAVLPQSEATALESLQQLGLHVSSTTITVTRRAFPGGEPIALNPITLITGDR